MLKHRLIFGGLMIPLLLALLWLDQRAEAWGAAPGLVLTAGFGAVGVLAAWELAGMLRAKGVVTRGPTLAVVALLGLVCMQLLGLGTLPEAERLPLLSTAAAAALLGPLLWHARNREPEGALIAGAIAVFTLVYLGVLPGFWLLVRHDHSAWAVAGAVLVIKSCDIGAYFTGRFAGRRKLIPWLSPGKTWEGLLGGMLTAAGLAVGLTAWGNAAEAFGRPGADGATASLSLGYAAFCGALLALVGQFGDLVASLLKRDAGVKDSGSGVPGFGGVLDVADSVIVAGPAVYWLLWFGARSAGA
ncbi:MAG: phosphatidate cytidylyltransferase [Planctomycetota bacterium]